MLSNLPPSFEYKFITTKMVKYILKRMIISFTLLLLPYISSLLMSSAPTPLFPEDLKHLRLFNSQTNKFKKYSYSL